MEIVRDNSDRYLLNESYLRESVEVYGRESTFSVSPFDGDNQYPQNDIETTFRSLLYRIEIEDVKFRGQVPLCKDLAFRLTFRYDWTEIICSLDKQCVSILNKDELREQMESMNQIIQGDYPQESNNSAWDYLDDHSPNSPIMQYRYFALLFPDSMLLKGERERVIRVSEDVPYMFRERLLSQKENLTNGNIMYQLTGTVVDNERISLQKFQTQICKDANTDNVNNATAKIIFINDESLKEEWNFNLASI